MVSSVRPEHGVGGRAFFSFLTAQFLGAFNDNYFKQLVLLVCVTASLSSESETTVPWKEIAMAVFALPFVMFSGVGGFLSDRCSKRTVIVGCKVAEIAIVCLSLGLLLIPGLTQQLQLSLFIAMLGLMGGTVRFSVPRNTEFCRSSFVKISCDR